MGLWLLGASALWNLIEEGVTQSSSLEQSMVTDIHGKKLQIQIHSWANTVANFMTFYVDDVRFTLIYYIQRLYLYY